METFAEFFKGKLGDRNIRAFATATGCSPSAVSKAQNDEAAPPLKYIHAWARELGLNTEEEVRFRQLAEDRRINAKADSRDRFAEVRERLDRAELLALRMSDLLIQKGFQLPKEILDALSAIKEERKR